MSLLCVCFREREIPLNHHQRIVAELTFQCVDITAVPQVFHRECMPEPMSADMRDAGFFSETAE